MSAHHPGQNPEKLIRGIIGAPDRAKQALKDTMDAYREQHGNLPSIGDLKHLAKKLSGHEKQAFQFIQAQYNVCCSEMSSKQSTKH